MTADDILFESWRRILIRTLVCLTSYLIRSVAGSEVGGCEGSKEMAGKNKMLTMATEKYDEDDIAHMRKVVNYCKRHLAQEEKAKMNTESKSYKSLKNGGHDPLKA
jgi:hypothetical protein